MWAKRLCEEKEYAISYASILLKVNLSATSVGSAIDFWYHLQKYDWKSKSGFKGIKRYFWEFRNVII